MIKDYTMEVQENNNDCLNNYCLNKEQCNCILYISFLSLFSCIYGLSILASKSIKKIIE